MQKLVGASRALSARPEFSAVQNLKSIDVISVRLWLDRRIDFQFPANVLAGCEREAGSTFCDLNVLQGISTPIECVATFLIASSAGHEVFRKWCTRV